MSFTQLLSTNGGKAVLFAGAVVGVLCVLLSIILSDFYFSRRARLHKQKSVKNLHELTTEFVDITFSMKREQLLADLKALDMNLNEYTTALFNIIPLPWAGHAKKFGGGKFIVKDALFTVYVTPLPQLADDAAKAELN